MFRELRDIQGLLPKQDYSVLEGRYLNQGEKSPYWVMVQKNREVEK